MGVETEKDEREQHNEENEGSGCWHRQVGRRAGGSECGETEPRREKGKGKKKKKEKKRKKERKRERERRGKKKAHLA